MRKLVFLSKKILSNKEVQDFIIKSNLIAVPIPIRELMKNSNFENAPKAAYEYFKPILNSREVLAIVALRNTESKFLKSFADVLREKNKPTEFKSFSTVEELLIYLTRLKAFDAGLIDDLLEFH